jgi:hypothetical protein
MKWLLPLVAMAAAQAYGAKNVMVAGVAWDSSLGSAEARAKREHKPILLLQMFGRLDDALC